MAEFSRRSSRTSMRSKQLGQLLIENGDVTAEQVAQALKTQDAQGGMLGMILQQMGVCSPEAIGHALAKQVQVTDIICEELVVPPEVTELVSKDFCHREKLCPFESLGTLLCIVMSNPLNHKPIQDIEGNTHFKVKAFKAPWPKINDLIEQSYAAAPPLEEISLELEGEPSNIPTPPGAKNAANIPTRGAPPVTRTASVTPGAVPQPLPLEDDIIIPPSQPEDESDAQTGILEAPEETVPVPSQANIPRPRFAQPSVQPKIKGLEKLTSGDAELIDVAKKKTESGKIASLKQAEPKKARVNVDLESFDHSGGEAELIDTDVPPESEGVYEIENGGVDAGTAREGGEVLVALKIVPDSYFYSGVAPKNAPRSDELLDVIEALPVAEVVAPSIVEYERKKSGLDIATPSESSKLLGVGIGLAGKSRVDLQRAPATPMAAVRLGEGEFHKLTLMQVEDEAGEWEWNVASPGPVAVEAFED
ncbi:MAG TPA: hypothetical protein VKX17_09330 [Planctomycetota bacterium]|nr:hypothetical protein [Planctomycetota bacterium]